MKFASFDPVQSSRVAIGLALFVMLAFWIRTGAVPPASGGDEVWWSEAAYQWRQDGVLRWACLDDAAGSAVRSFWPPVVPLLQAGFIGVFGLTPFGVTVQSPAIATLLLGAVYALARRLGFAPARALTAAVATLGLLMVERRLVQVRMENLTALTAVGAALLLFRTRVAPQPPGARWSASVAGVGAGIGCISYYPQAPFLLLAVAGWLFLLRAADRPAAFGGAVLGAAAVGAPFAWWVLPHWAMFRMQVLGVGADHYFSFANLAHPFTNLGPGVPLVERFQQAEKWLVFLLGLHATARGCTVEIRALGWGALAGLLTMFCYQQPLPVFGGVFATLLVFHPDLAPAGGWLARTQPWLGRWLACAAVTSLGLTAFTGWYQRDGRDYAVVTRELVAAVPASARTGISQEAWLALRPRISAANLHLLVYSDLSVSHRPRVALGPDAADYFDYLVLSRGRAEDLGRMYPWLPGALAARHFRLVRTVAPAFRPLPWASVPVYDLLVYENTRRIPGAAR